MYELIQLSEHDFYMDCPVKTGLVLFEEGKVIAVDSGLDKGTGKKLLRHVEENGWKLEAVINTHSNADHIGGNRFLQDKTGCRIYAPGLERTFTNRPELEPMTLYGGLPFKDLQGKFMMAPSSRAEELTPDVLPKGMEIIPLPGHSFDMAGLRTADGNLFLADCLSSEETLAKYGIGYLWDAGKYIETLKQVMEMKALHFVPAHAAVTEDIRELAQKNIDAVEALLEKIQELCRKPRIFEELLHELFASYNMTMNMQQYVLIGSTVKSCLSGLVTAGKVKYYCEDAYIFWQTI